MGSGAGTGITLPDSGLAAAGGAAGESSCAAEAAVAESVPVDLFILLDQSGSMTLEGNRWDPVTSAIKGFVKAPESAGLGVGLQYFPLGATATEDIKICNVQNYVAPAVPIGALPENEANLISSIDSHRFTTAEARDAAHWGTPTKPAVQGVLQYLQNHVAQNSQHATYLLLATDGKPSNNGANGVCPDNWIPQIAEVLTQAASATPPIRTYVIGIGEIERLGELAVAGGTGQPPFIVDGAGTNTQQQLTKALSEIRKLALPCDYAIPAPTSGSIDFGKVNVEVSTSAGKRTFPKVQDVSACTAAQQNWYYDDAKAPTKIIMCPAACDALKIDAAKIDILFGCETIVQPPPR